MAKKKKEEEETRGLLEIVVDDEAARAELDELVKAGLIDKEVAAYLRGERKSKAEYEAIISTKWPRLKGAPKKQIEEELKKEGVEAVLKLLPRVILKKVRDRVPEDFEIKQIVFSGEISGKPFGIGVGGTVQIVFEKKTATAP